MSTFFAPCAELDPRSSPRNDGLVLYQFEQDIGAAQRCCHEALRIDSKREAAVSTLAQLSLQQVKIKEAVELFHRQSELAWTEPELFNELTYEYATKAQSRAGYN